MRFARRLNSLVAQLAAVAVLALAGTAQAQVEAFKIRGAGVGPEALPFPGQPPRPHWIVGYATHLGKHTGEGTIETDSVTPHPETGTITGTFRSGSPFVFTAANGDKLACDYGRGADPGEFELTIVDVLEDGSLVVVSHLVAEFVPIPDQSTGKFAGVTGGWTMYAWTEPFVLGSSDPVAYWWEGSGTLTFANHK